MASESNSVPCELDLRLPPRKRALSNYNMMILLAHELAGNHNNQKQKNPSEEDANQNVEENVGKDVDEAQESKVKTMPKKFWLSRFEQAENNHGQCQVEQFGEPERRPPIRLRLSQRIQEKMGLNFESNRRKVLIKRGRPPKMTIVWDENLELELRPPLKTRQSIRRLYRRRPSKRFIRSMLP